MDHSPAVPTDGSNVDNSREARITRFVEWVRDHISGDEKGEAQLFVDRLLQAFGQKGLLEVGGKAEFRIKKSAEDGGGTSFADYVWKPIVLIEMKKRGVDLAKHYNQAFKYWERLVPGRPQYVVLCNFDEFWVYDFNTQLDEPVDRLALADLPERWGPLAFLFPTSEAPKFKNNQEDVTREAADRLATLFNKLIGRGIEREQAQRFVLQCLVALFAEDIKLLEKYTFARLLDDCKTPAQAYDLIGGLFVEMNTPGITAGGRYKGVDYFNGGLFADPVRLELHEDEVAQLAKSAEANWSKVRPEIFGTIFEHSVEAEERHAYGAHFTSGVDIMKIVRPTILEPWEAMIDGATTQKQLEALHDRLQTLRVLDPACGSGNFLYLAYRAMKRLEQRIFERLDSLSKKGKQTKRLSFVTAKQFYGMDINPFAVELAKVTMMIARKLAIDELHMDERALPLDNLDANFKVCDALVTPFEGGVSFRTDWPPADVIIGNPPFLDARKVTLEHGIAYGKSLETLYPEITRRSDYCVYWIRRSHDHLPECTPEDPFAGRAGLVGTQNIRNNEAREGGLEYVAKSGTVIEAVDNQPWSGEANVHVSIANWVKHSLPPRYTPREQRMIESKLLIPAKRKLWSKIDSSLRPAGRRKAGQGSAAKVFELSLELVPQINSALSSEVDLSSAKVLEVSRNPKSCFEGIQTGHKGFVITKAEAERLLALYPDSTDYVKPFLNGADLLTGKFLVDPEYVIDLSRTNAIEASQFPKVLAVIQERVLPDWQSNAAKELDKTGKSTGEHQNRLQTWWALKRPRLDLQEAMSKRNRVVACSAVMKRPTFVFLSSRILPTNALKVFTFDDDYSFGLLQSNTHWQWFIARCSKLKSDFRYTPETVFDTFPWPQSPSVKQIEAVASASCEIRRVRDDALSKIKGGLRAVYRTLELPGKNPLKDAQAALDNAVLQAYGFDPRSDLLQQLLDLNLEVAARIDKGEPVTAPGIPPDYPNPSELVTDDCIRPA
ncbi:DNA methyltransferase [Aeoliella sp. SH292]|uniref:DNA methyltransferase n=1 Tax=Aeoliella sp. SH292 TaxID=3454464 RepID=UPI003F9BB18F